MSEDLNLVVLLKSIYVDLFRYGGTSLIAVGTIGCVLSLLVFTQKNFRKNPCSNYLIAYNTSNLLLIYTSILFATLSAGYGIEPTSSNLFLCRFRSYTMFLFDALSPSYLILASVDRVLVTSKNALTRKRSTVRLARCTIAAITLFWAAGQSHMLVLAELIAIIPGVPTCYFPSAIHVTIVSYYSVLVRAMLMPGLMIVLGLWTVRNAQRVTPVVTNAEANTRTFHTKDRQLIKILLTDTSVYIASNLMNSIVLLYQQFAGNLFATYTLVILNAFLLNVSVFCTYIPYCMSCYTNLLISKTFRQEMKNALRWK